MANALPAIRRLPLLDRVREGREARSAWHHVRRAELQYARALLAVARQVGVLVRGLGPSTDTLRHVEEMLRRYADLIAPWARAVGQRMLGEVARRDETAWRRHAKTMNRALAAEIAHAPTGEMLRGLLEEQVHFITSLPLEAAQRVQKLALEAVESGARYGEIEKEILASGEVAASRARLIARTEVARAASGLVQVRAEFIGSTHYQWTTARDLRVRPLHKKLAGRVFRWDDPPVIMESGQRGPPGASPNCRCVAIPILSEERD